MNPVSDKLKSKKTSSTAKRNDTVETVSRDKNKPGSSVTSVKNAQEKTDSDKSFKKLLKKIKKYNPHLDDRILNKAYEFSKKHHAKQFRKSGEPFISFRWRWKIKRFCRRIGRRRVYS